MNFLRDLFEGNQDEDYVHQRFVRYGKGQYMGAACEIKKYGSSLKVSGSYGYENILGHLIVSMAAEDELEVEAKGNIVSFDDIYDSLIEELGNNLKKPRKKRSTLIYKVTGKHDPSSLKNVYESFPENQFFLDLNADGYKLKCKNSPRKPGKDIDIKFAKADFPLERKDEVLEELLFDSNADPVEDGKVRIEYIYEINDFDIPEGCENARQMRLHAKRVGTVKRKVSYGEKEEVMEEELRA